MTQWINEALEDLKSHQLYRQFRVIESIKGNQAVVAGRKVTLFCGNDYLGLSQHPSVIKASQQALKTWGVGAGSARLIAGTSKPCFELEEKIARFEGKERALVFSSGYLANLGTLSALAGPEDLVIFDKLNHASLVDAARLSQATLRVYPHKNLDYLEKLLKRIRARRVWIVTDSVFSMDGDLAPLRELVKLKNRYGAYLVIDEAHGTGVFGKAGRGLAEALGVAEEIDIHIGTLSKAVGALGGFVCGKKHMIDFLINRSRTFIFATALPPAICAAASAAFDVIEKSKKLRTKLWHNVETLERGLKKMDLGFSAAVSPIVPVVFGEEERALKASSLLLEKGYLVPAVRYPAVAKGKARLRVTVSCGHEAKELTGFLSAMRETVKTLR